MIPRMRYLGLKWQVMLLITLGRRQAAREVLDQMMVEYPGDYYPVASMAQLLAQDRDLRGALRWQRQLTAAHPRDAAAWFNQGYLLEELGDYEDARESFGRALDIDPKLDRAWYGLGLVLIRLRRLDEAVDALKKNTELQPMSPYGWYQLARVHVDRSEPDEARRIIRHLKGFEPKVAAQLERETGIVASRTS